MINGEKRALDFIEKHIFLIIIMIITAAAFLFRRQVIWFRTEDFQAWFDMHDHNANTAFYYLCIYLLGYIFPLPLNGWKWVLSAADFAVALLCLGICRKELKEKGKLTEYERIRLLFLYAGCLLAPVFYIRGSVWAQPDAPAFAFLLIGYVLLKKNRIIPAVLLAGAGSALYPPCFVFAAVYVLAAGHPLYLWPAVAAVSAGLEAICGPGAGIGPGEAQLRMLRFLVYHPATGQMYAGAGEWLWHIFLMGGYGMALVSAVMAFRRKMPYPAVILFHTVVAVCFSIALGWIG